MTAAQQTQEKIRSLELEVLLHSSHSSDLAPTDFHLFHSQEHFICSRTCKNKEVENNLSNFFFEETKISLNGELKFYLPVGH